MTPTVLDPTALIAAIPQYLQGVRTLSRPNDALTALVHAVLVALGFRLVSSDASSNVLPDDWGRDAHLLRYRHEQSNLDYSVSVTQLGSRTIVNAISSPVCLLHMFLLGSLSIGRLARLSGCPN